MVSELTAVYIFEWLMWVGYTTVGNLCRLRAIRFSQGCQSWSSPMSPFQSRRMRDQSWCGLLTVETSLTQGKTFINPPGALQAFFRVRVNTRDARCDAGASAAVAEKHLEAGVVSPNR